MSHPDLFVLNTARKPAPNYLMLHRAPCRAISSAPTRGLRWTSEYIKFCGQRDELEKGSSVEAVRPTCRACVGLS